MLFPSHDPVGGKKKTNQPTKKSVFLHETLVEMDIPEKQHFKTELGMLTSPFPKLDDSTTRKRNASLRRYYIWLLQNGRRQAERTKNKILLQTIGDELRRLESSKKHRVLPQAEVEQINLILFDDINGPQQKHYTDEKTAIVEHYASPENVARDVDARFDKGDYVNIIKQD